MAPISRREQVELDELLSDIYRGIETLPDHSRSQDERSYIVTRNDTGRDKSPIIGRAYVREFEVNESSPLVQRHKLALAASQNSYKAPQEQQPARSSLKRQTGGGETPDLRASSAHNNQSSPQASQSLASFLNAHPVSKAPPTSSTPDNKRRVRILDHPDKASANRPAYQSASEEDEDYALNDYYNEPPAAAANQFDSVYVSTGGSPRKSPAKEKVKYVNTNKLIYHQERDFEGENEAERRNRRERASDSENDDDDIDGVTRTEFYHTTWLDRQLGRASKRRSSKELNERQVKEKAMIEELKRSLKNGAITLKQSFKGKKNGRNTDKASDIFDSLDNNNNNNNNNNAANSHNHWPQHANPYNSHEKPQVVKTGIATLPRNPHKKQSSNQQAKRHEQHTSSWSQTLAPRSKTNFYQSERLEPEPSQPTRAQQEASANRLESPSARPSQARQHIAEPQQSTTYSTSLGQQSTISRPAGSGTQPKAPMQTTHQDTTTTNQAYSRTLPHKKPDQPHQLLQSHYRGNLSLHKSNTLHRIGSPRPAPTPISYSPSTVNQSHLQPHLQSTPQQQQQQQQSNQQQPNQQSIDKMRNPAYNQTNNPACVSPHGGTKSPLQQSVGNTISGMPSATEVVRSALSRSSSQVSLNQLNKTINLLPNSPPAPSPMSPTHQLRAHSPSLSPSPAPPMHHAYGSKTLGHQHQPAYQQQQQQQHQYLPGQTVLHGTRTVGRPPQQQQQPQQHQSQQQMTPTQQPVYANPHASLMQHRMEQQAKVPNRNVASIREFNELDSLLRSLSPGMPAYSSTQVAPGYSSKPAQASLGGYMPASYQQQLQQQQVPAASPYTRPITSDLYAKVQKPQPTSFPQAQPHLQQQQQQQQQQQHQPTGPGIIGSSQPYTIDVSDKKVDENCVQRQRQDVSEFESPVELLPSMEDYQNIGKLNPVKNYYWYKPNMSREVAIHLLKDKPQGSFIVRDSTSFKGAYGLAVRVAKLPKNVLANLRSSNGDQSAEYIRHFLIEPVGAGVRLKGYANEPVFDSLPDLIYQHSLTELALPCKLIIPRADIEDPRFNQKQKQFFDEFIASKEQAKHQPYERTSPDGGYRRYPGNVLVHNEHRIIFQ